MCPPPLACVEEAALRLVVPLSFWARTEFEELMRVTLELDQHELEEIILLVQRLTEALEEVERFLEDTGDIDERCIST